MSYAGFWKRFAAALIDSIVGIIILLGAALILAVITGQNSDPGTGNFFRILDFIFGWLYFAGMESSSTQGTLGKMALKIKVTDLEGNRISFGRATLRYFSKILSILILFIGFIMAGFTKKKQALHDIIAGFFVVNK